jgi:hypothetical protein
MKKRSLDLFIFGPGENNEAGFCESDFLSEPVNAEAGRWGKKKRFSMENLFIGNQ